MDRKYVLEYLLSLDGDATAVGKGYQVRWRGRLTVATEERPHGLKYSLTLHDASGERILGYDNAIFLKKHGKFDHSTVGAIFAIINMWMQKHF